MAVTISHQQFRSLYLGSVATRTKRKVWANTKIRRIVRASMRLPEFTIDEPDDVGLEGVSQITDSTQPVLLRCAWFFVILISVSICVYQIYNCVATYIDQPIAVDVEIREQEKLQFPSLTLANMESNGLYKLWNKVSPDNPIDVQFTACLAPVRPLMVDAKDMTVRELWNELNSSQTLQSYKVVAPNKEYAFKMQEEYGLTALQSKMQLDEYIPYGGVNTKFKLIVRKIPYGCPTTQLIGSIQDNGMPTDTRTTWAFTTMLVLDMMFEMKQFKYVSRWKDPCVDDKTYHQCRIKCAVDTFKNYTCRFPFLPEEVKLPSCIAGSEDVRKLHTEILVKFVRLNCSCPRQCQDTAFSIAVTVAGKIANVTTLSAYFLNNLKTTIKERLAYDIISLMSDMGGSLGLCLGFSVLSIFQLMQGLIRAAKRLISRPQKSIDLFRSDPIVCQVRRILREELLVFRQNRPQQNESESLFIGINKIVDTEAPILQRLIWLFIISVCVMSYFLFVYIRINSYLADPTRMKVEITKGDKVHFPTIAICGNNFDTIMRFRYLGKMRKVTRRRMRSGKMMYDWCSFQLYDLLDVPNVNAEKAWDFQTVVPEHLRADDIGEFVLGYKFLENVSNRSVHLPEGTCAEFSVGEQIYSGTNTIFSKLTISRIDENAVNDEVVECDRDYNTVYLTPPNGTLHLRSRLIYPKQKKTMLLLESKKVTLLNLRRKPCIDEQSANECSTRCFDKIVSKLVKCRLPYMPAIPNITNCTTAVESKSSHNAYIDFAYTFDPLTNLNCSCIPSCTKTIITTAVYIEPTEIGKMTLLGTVYFSNIQQHVIEVPADTLSKLLCDLGGNLGLALGVSLLSIFYMMQSLGSSICHHLSTNCKPKQKNDVIRLGNVPEMKEDSLRVIRSQATGSYCYTLTQTHFPQDNVLSPMSIAYNKMVSTKTRPEYY